MEDLQIPAAIKYYLTYDRAICLSGGADGADIEWARGALILGHKVIHWSFPSHQSTAPEDQLVRLTDEELEIGDEAIEHAALALGQSVPQRPHVARLIRRIYYQVAWSTSCYAVTTLKDGRVPGGTAWATTMFTQLHPGNDHLYVFDQGTGAWYHYADNAWLRIDKPPQPTGIWAGVGARDLKDNGQQAIRNLTSADSPDA